MTAIEGMGVEVAREHDGAAFARERVRDHCGPARRDARAWCTRGAWRPRRTRLRGAGSPRRARSDARPCVPRGRTAASSHRTQQVHDADLADGPARQHRDAEQPSSFSRPAAVTGRRPGPTVVSRKSGAQTACRFSARRDPRSRRGFRPGRSRGPPRRASRCPGAASSARVRNACLTCSYEVAVLDVPPDHPHGIGVARGFRWPITPYRRTLCRSASDRVRVSVRAALLIVAIYVTARNQRAAFVQVSRSRAMTARTEARAPSGASAGRRCEVKHVWPRFLSWAGPVAVARVDAGGAPR